MQLYFLWRWETEGKKRDLGFCLISSNFSPQLRWNWVAEEQRGKKKEEYFFFSRKGNFNDGTGKGKALS